MAPRRIDNELRAYLCAFRGTTLEMLDEMESLFESFGAQAMPFHIDGSTHPSAHDDDGAGILLGLATALGVFRSLAVMRHADLMDDFLIALEQRRPFGVALFARAWLETSAAVCFHWERVAHEFDGVQEDAERLMSASRRAWQATSGTRFAWSTWLADLGAGQQVLDEYQGAAKQSGGGTATNVLTMLEALRRCVAEATPGAEGHVGFAYAFLSDACHPSLGGHVFYVSRSARAQLEIAREEARRAAPFVAGNVMPALV